MTIIFLFEFLVYSGTNTILFLCLFFFFKDYIHASKPKAQESELKISAVFSVGDSPLGKKQNCKLVTIRICYVLTGRMDGKYLLL